MLSINRKSDGNTDQPETLQAPDATKITLLFGTRYSATEQNSHTVESPRGTSAGGCQARTPDTSQARAVDSASSAENRI